MNKVIAAIDNTAAARPVIASGRVLTRLFAADLEALHVREDGSGIARSVAAATGVRFREIEGPVVKSLVEEAMSDDVVALVLGARGTPGGRRPAGHTALDVITSITKPVEIVPPDARIPTELSRVLIPLDGSVASSSAVAELTRLACRVELDIVVLHVHDAGSIPAFSDQPHHEAEAWVREFLARHCPEPSARGKLRAGVPGPEIMAVATEGGSELIALGWAQDLTAPRAAVVKEILEHATIPVLLLPVAPSGQLESSRGAPLS